MDPLILDKKTAEAKGLLAAWTATQTTHTGKDVQYPVYKDMGDYVKFPRFAFGVPVAKQASGTYTCIKCENPPPVFAGRLQPKQVSGAAEALNILKSHSGVFINAAPGSGKTVIGIYLASCVKSCRTLVMVDQDNLAQQWAERIRQFAPEATISFIMPVESQRAILKKVKLPIPSDMQACDLRGQFIIASTQSMVAHPKEFWVDLLIVDECHSFSAPTFCQAIYNVSFHRSIALSATERRRDGLEWVFRAMVGATKVTLEGERLPARAKFVAVSTRHLNWDDPRLAFQRRTDFIAMWCVPNKCQTTLLRCKMCKDYLGIGIPDIYSACARRLRAGDEMDENTLEVHAANDDLYQLWFLDTINDAVQAGRKIFVFARIKKTLDALNDMIHKVLGPVSGTYMGATATRADRIALEAALKKPITLATYGKAGKGLDVQEKDGILFVGLPSKNTLEQVIGRVERAMAGKSRPVIIHGVLPFMTSLARMNGSINWYLERNYDYTVEQKLDPYCKGVGGRRSQRQG